MQRQDYCVYNQTNECFLSLGATLGDRPFARLKQRFNIGRRRAHEGSWFKPYEPLRALTLFATHDLLYLDADHRVLHSIEGFPALRIVPPHQDAVSLLALPVHTISSSQTKCGNRLLICVPAEMERKLRKLFEPNQNAGRALTSIQPDLAQLKHAPKQAAADPAHTVTVPVYRNAQTPATSPAPCADGGDISMHAIRDLSATGLYLVTRDRWPIGAEINMNLQPGGLTDSNGSPIVVRMRVTDWGTDGVALEFAGATAETSDSKSLYVC
jgi:hypothetical protein